MNEIKEKSLLLGKEDAREEMREWRKLEKLAMKGSWSKTQKEKVKKLINTKNIIILASLNTLLGGVFSSTSLGFNGQIPIIINHVFMFFTKPIPIFCLPNQLASPSKCL